MKRNYPLKKCECGSMFTPTGPRSIRCESCKKIANAATREREYARRCLKKGINCGAGTGNFEHAKGKDSKCYSTGKGEYVRARKEVLEELGCCERCGKDLTKVHHSLRVIHHRDHDRSNNVRSNMELLCKRCHQIHHNCEEAFHKRVTTS